MGVNDTAPPLDGRVYEEDIIGIGVFDDAADIEYWSREIADTFFLLHFCFLELYLQRFAHNILLVQRMLLKLLLIVLLLFFSFFYFIN